MSSELDYSPVAQQLAQLQKQGLDRLDAQLLLLHVLQRPAHDRAWLLAHDTDLVAPDRQAALTRLAARRLDGEPLAYLTGHKEFYGLDLVVDARVLDPRADTETLVDWALDLLHNQPGAKVVDLGTGSGAIALALKATRPDLQVTAVDYSVDALDVAQSNATRLQLDIEFLQGSWLATLTANGSRRVDVIASNPPYIPVADRHLAALAHEPLQALVSGTDGLDDIRQIIRQSAKHLSANGWLLLEHGYDQADAVQQLFREAGFSQVQSRQDLAGIARCTGGMWVTPKT